MLKPIQLKHQPKRPMIISHPKVEEVVEVKLISENPVKPIECSGNFEDYGKGTASIEDKSKSKKHKKNK